MKAGFPISGLSSADALEAFPVCLQKFPVCRRKFPVFTEQGILPQVINFKNEFS